MSNLYIQLQSDIVELNKSVKRVHQTRESKFMTKSLQAMESRNPIVMRTENIDEEYHANHNMIRATGNKKRKLADDIDAAKPKVGNVEYDLSKMKLL